MSVHLHEVHAWIASGPPETDSYASAQELAELVFNFAFSRGFTVSYRHEEEATRVEVRP